MSRGTEHRRAGSIEDVSARSLVKAFGITYDAAVGQVVGSKCATVPVASWSVLLFPTEIDLEVGHYLLAKRGLRAMRTTDELGHRLWLRWDGEPDTEVARRWFALALGTIEHVLAEGTAPAPYWRGSGAVDVSGRMTTVGHLMVERGNPLGVLARRIGGVK